MHCEECAEQRAGRLPGSSPIHIVTDTYRHRYISSPIHGETSTALTGDWGIPRANVDVTDDAPIYIPSFGHGELYG
jgi:hypothetical protein